MSRQLAFRQRCNFLNVKIQLNWQKKYFGCTLLPLKWTDFSAKCWGFECWSDQAFNVWGTVSFTNVYKSTHSSLNHWVKVLEAHCHPGLHTDDPPLEWFPHKCGNRSSVSVFHWAPGSITPAWSTVLFFYRCPRNCKKQKNLQRLFFYRRCMFLRMRKKKDLNSIYEKQSSAFFKPSITRSRLAVARHVAIPTLKEV